MNWADILQKIIFWLLGLAGTGATAFVTYLINKFIKNKEYKELVTATVNNCVLDVYQTYVEYFKDNNIFDEAKQKEALQRCLDLIKQNIPTTALNWLNKIYNDVDNHLITLIESNIAKSKKGE